MSNCRIQVFSLFGAYKRKIVYGLMIPQGIFIDNNDSGKIYVADITNKCIQVFNNDGSFNHAWGTAGVGDEQFLFPYGIYIYNNEVYVSDYSNHRIQVFRTDGSFKRKWGSAGVGDEQNEGPGLLNVCDDKTVYVTDIGNSRIQAFGTDGAFKGKWGSYGVGDGQFSRPYGLYVYNNLIFVTDFDNHRIQVIKRDFL